MELCCIGIIFFGNTSGSNNSFFGNNSGAGNSTGNNNTLLGAGADVTSGNLQFATAIGAGATADQSNRIVLGRNSGADTVRIPGSLSIANSLSTPDIFAGDVQVSGTLKINLSGGGATALCGSFSGLYTVSTCSSSRRYKDDIQDFAGSLELLKRFRPVTFRWKNTGQRDVGFVAEEVAEIEPLLATYNPQNQIEGVKYAQITTVLVNSVKEQQAQIEKLEEQIKKQNEQIEVLKALVCSQNQQPAACLEKVREEPKNQ